MESNHLQPVQISFTLNHIGILIFLLMRGPTSVSSTVPISGSNSTVFSRESFPKTIDYGATPTATSTSIRKQSQLLFSVITSIRTEQCCYTDGCNKC